MDIFIKDLASGAVTRVSTAADGSQGANSAIAYANWSTSARFSPEVWTRPRSSHS